MYCSRVEPTAFKEFFRNHKKMEMGSTTAPRAEAPPQQEEKRKESTDKKNNSSSVYEIVDPIQTSAGLIGQFIPTPDAMPNHPSIVLFGKRRTGKSFSLRSIMFNCFRDVPFGKFTCLPLRLT